jgi:DNA-binding Lrp family transcriptional regulator
VPPCGRNATEPKEFRKGVTTFAKIAHEVRHWRDAERSTARRPRRHDRAILEALSEDARIPNNRLASGSASPRRRACARARPARSGVLRGFHAEVDLGRPRPPAAGDGRRAARRVHHREEIEAFTRAVRELPGVLSVFHVAGVNDYLVWVAAADAQDLREFVVDHHRDASVGRPRGDVAHLRAPPWTRPLAEPQTPTVAICNRDMFLTGG